MNYPWCLHVKETECLTETHKKEKNEHDVKSEKNKKNKNVFTRYLLFQVQ